MSNMSYKRQELLTLCEHMGSPPVFGGVRVAHLFFSFLCVVFFVLSGIALCSVYPMLPVSLDCPFFINPSVFCNDY